MIVDGSTFFVGRFELNDGGPGRVFRSVDLGGSRRELGVGIPSLRADRGETRSGAAYVVFEALGNFADGGCGGVAFD